MQVLTTHHLIGNLQGVAILLIIDLVKSVRLINGVTATMQTHILEELVLLIQVMALTRLILYAHGLIRFQAFLQKQC